MVNLSRAILTLSGQTLPRAAFPLDSDGIHSVLRAQDPDVVALAITRAAEAQDKKIGASEINAVLITVLVDLFIGALILFFAAWSAPFLPNFVSLILIAFVAGLSNTLMIWAGIATSDYFSKALKRAYRGALFTQFLWLRTIEFVAATLAIGTLLVSFNLFDIRSNGALVQLVQFSEQIIGFAEYLWPDRLSFQQVYAETFGRLLSMAASSGIWWMLMRYNNGFVRRPEKRRASI